MNSNIKTFFILISFISLLLLLSVLITVKKVNDNSYRLSELHKDKYEMTLYANLLRQTSDDLTKFARLYVVTDNKTYKENYYSILDIRNGAKKRPEKYTGIYWDILEPLRSTNHPLKKRKSMSDILKSLPYDDFEYKKLKEAEDNSNELVDFEVEAFNAMVGLYKDENTNYSKHKDKNQQKAIELLHSKNYLKEKEKIMLSLDSFLSHLDTRTNEKIFEVHNDMLLFRNILIITMLICILAFSLFIYAIIQKILKPITHITEDVQYFKGSRKSKKNRKIFYDDEIGYMTREFYNMIDNINTDIDNLLINENKIKNYVSLVDKNIITSSTDLTGKITYVSEAFCEISGYTKEELLGNKHSMVKHPDMPSTIYDELWETITKDKTWRGEIKNRKRDGSYYWVDVAIYPIYDHKDEKIGYTAIRVDITNNKKVEELLEESKERENKIQNYVSLVDKNIITSSTDLTGKITYVSEAFSKISGYTKEELLGNKHSMVKHPDMPSRIYDELWESITLNRKWNGELKNRTKNGGFYWVDATIYPQFNEKGEKTGYTAIRINITDRKKVEELLITDGLTGIYNRRYFNEILSVAINIAKRDKKYFSFLIMDIDHFKQYNDTYGHQAGDTVLIKVAAAIKDTLKRGIDKCFRLGGEEFGVLFETLNPEEAYKFATEIKYNIENLKLVHEKNSASKYITVSMGLVTKHSEEIIIDDEVYKEADDYLYKAKESGRNKVEAN